MTSKKQLFFAYGLAIHLLLVGIVCYAAFPQKASSPPLRSVYHTLAGRVIFDHQTHASDTGYGLACADCHHHPKDSDDALQACSACHQTLPEGQSHPQYCLDCHDESEIEDTENLNFGDAAHQQCIGCHKDFGAGPVECSQCHVR